MIIGRLFLRAEDSLRDLHIPSYKDYMIAGIQCYLVSIEVLNLIPSVCVLGMGDIDKYVYE